MARRMTRIGLLIALDPERAKRELLAALKHNGWSTRRAAAELGVDWATAKRWVERLGLGRVVFDGQNARGPLARGGRRRPKRSV